MSKQALDYQAHLDRLKGRGLHVSDEPFALHRLANNSYFAVHRHSLTVNDCQRILDLIWMDSVDSHHRHLPRLSMEAHRGRFFIAPVVLSTGGYGDA